MQDAHGASDDQVFRVIVNADLVGHSHVGREFWFTHSPNYCVADKIGCTPASDPARSHWVTVAALEGAEGYVEIAGLNYRQNFTLAAGGIAEIQLPWQAMNVANLMAANKGIHVVSDRPVTVVSLNRLMASTDAAVIYPVEVLGTHYTVIDYPRLFGEGGQAAIVATQDNTVISIAPPATGRPVQRPGAAGTDAWSVTLQRGQAYAMSAWEGLSHFAPYSGTRIVASAPIAVFGGSLCADVPDEVSACNHLYEQLLPDRNLGQDFLAGDLATRAVGNMYRFVATEDDTAIYAGNRLIAVLRAGHTAQRILDGPVAIHATKPVQAFLIALGEHADSGRRDVPPGVPVSPSGDTDGDLLDPFAIALPPVGTELSDYLFTTAQEPAMKLHYAGITIPESAVASLRLDGAAVSGVTWRAIAGTGKVHGNLRVSVGRHRLDAAAPFGLIVYGYGYYEAYGYAGGLLIGNQDRVRRLEVTPLAQTRTVGDSACFAVVARDEQNKRIPYARFAVRVEGPLPRAESGYLDGTGRGEYCFDQPFPGLTPVTFQSGQAQLEAQVEWLAPTDGVNRAPVIVSLPQLELRDPQFSYDLDAVDPNGDVLEYVLVAGPAGAQIDAQSGVLSWTPAIPANRKALLQEFTVRARDAQGLYDEQIFEVQVHFPPKLEFIPQPAGFDDQVAYENTNYSVPIRGLGGFAALLRTDVIQGPPGMSAYLSDREGSILWRDAQSPALRHADTLQLGSWDNRVGSADIAMDTAWSQTSNLIAVPVFGRPLDTNADGVVNASDRLVVVGIGGGRVIARYVDTGDLLPWSGTPVANAALVPAFVDLNGDGKDEILYSSGSPPKLIAINGANQRVWATDPLLGANNLIYLQSSIESADLDGDGSPEIIAAGSVHGADGVRRWTIGTTSAGNIGSDTVHPLISDLDGDGSKEVLFFNEVRRANGTLWWSVPADGMPNNASSEFAVHDFDGDGKKEVIARVVSKGGSGIYRLERLAYNGTRLGPSITLQTEGCMPSIFDIDRDGSAEIYLPCERKAYAIDGSVRLARRANMPGVTTHSPLLGDVNRDGAVEAFGMTSAARISDVQSDWIWSTLRSASGADNRGLGAFVDSDGDGNAELFVAGYSNALEKPIRGVWPMDRAGRRSYRDGVERHAGSFGLELPPATQVAGLRYDAWIGDLRQRAGSDAAHKRYEVNVRNRGLRSMDHPLTVSLYAGSRGGGGRELARTTVAALRSDAVTAVQFPEVPVQQLSGWIYAYVDAAAAEATADIRLDNNVIGAHVIEVALTDGADRLDSIVHSVEVTEKSIALSLSGGLPEKIYSGHPVTLQLLANQIDADNAPHFSLVAPPKGVRIDPWTGVLTWTPTAAQAGNHSFSVRVKLFRGTEVLHTLYTQVIANPNRPPVITSTAPGYAVVGQAWSYAVAASDPDGDTLSYALDAPVLAGMSINAQTGVISWTPDAALEGTRRATVRVTDSAANATTQLFTVIVQTPATSIPVFTSNPPAMAKVGCVYTYDANAASASGASLVYGLYTKPAGMTIDSASGVLQWTPTAAQAGTQAVSVSARNTTSYAYQTWNVTVVGAERPLRLDVLAEPRYITLGQSALIGTVVTDPAGAYTLTATANGTPLTLDAQGGASYTPASIGAHTIAVNVSDGCQTAQATTTVYVADPADADAPAVDLISPEPDAVITKPTAVVGTVNDSHLASWRLALKENQGDSQYRVIASGTNNFSSAAFATLDPTLLMNGIHILVLEATDTSGRSSTDSVAVSIEGDMKVGHYSVTFLDVEVPLSGIPIRVTRTYDTRRAHEDLDFGYGWSVDYQNVSVRENRKLGFSWRLAQSGGGLTPWCVRPLSDPIVTVTLPHGEVEKFKAYFHPECQPYTATVYGELRFAPVGNTHSQLEQLDYGTIRVIEQGEAANLADPDSPNVPLDPGTYRLTTEEGLVYTIDQNFGIRTIQDQAANTITYSRDGIVHSSGRRVGFERDDMGRIVRITLPDGEARKYTYSPAGDLLTAADPLDNTSRFGYLQNPRWPHYLETIHDPRNTLIARHEYDAEGRLVATTDANNKRIEYTHNIAGKIETVKNRRGFTTTYVYDDNGWVLSETNALNEQTVHTYDENGNELTTKDPLNRVTMRTFDARGNLLTETNPAGETITRTYGRYNQLLTETDGQNRVVLTNTYWRNLVGEQTGFLTSSTDGLGNVTSYEMDLCLTMTCANTGDLTSIVDGNGNRLSFDYDLYGNMTQQTDAQGNVTARQYDAMGRVLTETRRRMVNGQREELVTTNEYDAAGNLIKSTAPDGVITLNTYTEGLLQHAQVGTFRKTHIYTPDGKVDTTYFGSSGGTERSIYDAEGNVVEQRDRMGRVTKMVYDAANRLTETIHPDGTGGDTDNPRSRQAFDKAGQLKTSWDERNQATSYEYDAAGRQIEVRNALNQVTAVEYDDNGRRVLERDALGRDVHSIYDIAGRLTRTVLPDPVVEDQDLSNNPYIDYSYDRMGRKIAQTDVAAPLSGIPPKTTRYAHDAAGRLTAVVLPNPQTGQNPEAIAEALARGEYPAAAISSNGVLVTRYSYDEQGNKIRQIDALGRATNWTYDKAGRVIRRTLPLGQYEEFRYDSRGVLDWSTDFNGQFTKYTHDPDHRLTNTRFGDNSELVLTYDNLTRPLTLSYGGITETRRYDERGRMDQVKWSDGQQIDYAYDKAGNRTSIATGTRTVTFGFDELNRLKTVSEAASVALGQTGAAKVTTFGYDDIGNRDHVVHSNGTRVDYRYDRMNRLVSLMHKKGAAVLLALGYTLNPDGTRAQIAEQVQQRDAQGQYLVDSLGQPVLDSTRTTDYVYDAVKRLVEESVTSATPGHARTTQWSYDGVGNRRSQILATAGGGMVVPSSTTTSYSYDDNDRLLNETAVSNGVSHTTTNRYDLNGNLTESITPEATIAYRWNAQNRLSQAEQRVGSLLDITQYTYTTEGVRRSQIRRAGTPDAREIRYLIDPNQAHAQVIEERIGNPLAIGGQVSSLALKAAYTYGEDLLGQYALRDATGSLLPGVGLPSGTPNPVAVAGTFHYDGLGTTRLLTDAAGNPVDQYAYHAFGDRDELASVLAAPDQPATDYQYTGEQFDSNLGFYYLRARYMDPKAGRFTAMDSWLGDVGTPESLHKYVYANASPTMFVDPTGHYTADFGRAVEDEVCDQYITQVPTGPATECGKVVYYDPSSYFKPDIMDWGIFKFNEIKPLSLSGIAKGIVQIELYTKAYQQWGFSPNLFWVPQTAVVNGDQVDFFNLSGVIFYTDDTALRREMAAATLATAAAIVRRHAVRITTKLGADAVARAALTRGLMAVSAANTARIHATFTMALMPL
ncbi:putative Ig domain-containing protein [Tahibacter harae]|uniref:Ig domain-containing protein n=1 Tax=Tahibacter harae TaxID=2963937 RepID=A0ABT1QUB1_9GAMM|nr:putative Ig domain-containing protein [Tahibacter harae]